MMFNKLLIDGKDAYAEYGVFVEQYGYKALVQMPSFKKDRKSTRLNSSH